MQLGPFGVRTMSCVVLAIIVPTDGAHLFGSQKAQLESYDGIKSQSPYPLWCCGPNSIVAR